MVGRRVAAVEPHERDRRRTVRQHLDIARDETEMPRVPRARFLEIGDLEHHVADPDDLRRRGGRALRVVDANARIHGVERERRAVRQRRQSRHAGHRIDAKTGRIDEPHALAAARPRRRLDARRTGHGGQREECPRGCRLRARTRQTPVWARGAPRSRSRTRRWRVTAAGRHRAMWFAIRSHSGNVRLRRDPGARRPGRRGRRLSSWAADGGQAGRW